MKDSMDEIRLCLDELRQEAENHNCDKIAEISDKLRLEIMEVHGELTRQVRLSEIERLIYNSPRSIDETMDIIAKAIKDEFGFSRFDIAVIDEELKRVFRRYSKGGFGEEDLLKLSKHGALNVTRDYAINNTEPWIVNDIMKEDPRWQVASELNVWIHATFPLYYKDKSGKMKLQGLIHGARNKRAFDSGDILDEQQIEELKRLGVAISNAMHDARLAYFEHGIMKIQNAIGSTRIEPSKQTDDQIFQEIRTQMDLVLDTIIESLNVSVAGIILNEKYSTKILTFRNDAKETIPPRMISISPRPLTGIVSRTLFGGYSVVEDEVVQNCDKMDLKMDDPGEKIYTLLSVPLIEAYSEKGKVRKNVIGVIVLLNKKDPKGRVIPTDFEGNEGGFTSTDRRLVESISPHIETIISNTKSHEDLQILSQTDGLTGLANHSHFMNNLLTMEFKRSQRYRMPLSVILADIDHFKVFNDIFGHQVGDLVLQEVAQTIKENSRDTDPIGRYGGEEFVILLPNTPLKDAIVYAEKIRGLVKEVDYIGLIRAKQLFNLMEARKRLEAIIDVEDNNVRNAKISIMEKHFGLNMVEVLNLIRSGNLEQAEDKILKSFKVSLSMGLSFHPSPEVSRKKDLITTADMLLLKAKEDGRDRIECVKVQ